MFDYEHRLKAAFKNIMENKNACDVIDHYKSIFYGHDEEDKKRNADMLFLADPNFDSKAWIQRAVKEYDTKDGIAEFRNIINDKAGIQFKCITMKAYRQLKKRKEPITITSLTDEVKSIGGGI